jgi:hypothetical protein
MHDVYHIIKTSIAFFIDAPYFAGAKELGMMYSTYSKLLLLFLVDAQHFMGTKELCMMIAHSQNFYCILLSMHHILWGHKSCA